MKVEAIRLYNPFLFFTFCLVQFFMGCNSGDGPIMKNKKIEQDSTYGSPVEMRSYDSTENAFQECSVKDMHWVAGDAETILLDPGPEYIFPGNVMDARSLQNGKYANLQGERTPITLIINSPAFNTPIWRVEDPSASTITTAIDTMLRSGVTGNVAADVTVHAHEVYSNEQLQIIMKSEFSGGFGSVAGGFDFKNATVLSRYLLDVAQVYYTIFIEAPKNHQFFKRQPEDLPETDPAPVYVSSVKYGRRVLISVESKEADQKKDAYLRAKMNAIASSGSIDLNLFSDNFFSDKDVKVLVKGGDASNAYKVFKAVSTKTELFDALEKDAHWSMSNLGVPLSYQVKNTTDNSNFYVSQAGDYKARICKIKDQHDSIINIDPIGPYCLWQTGGTDRNFGENPNSEAIITLKLDPNNKNIIRALIEVRMKEPGGDVTSGAYLNNLAVITLPEDYEITEITSATTFAKPSSQMKSQREENNGVDGATPIQSIVLIGDSPGDSNNDDDLFPGACMPNHAQIESIRFYPVSFRFSRKVAKTP